MSSNWYAYVAVVTTVVVVAVTGYWWRQRRRYRTALGSRSPASDLRAARMKRFQAQTSTPVAEDTTGQGSAPPNNDDSKTQSEDIKQASSLLMENDKVRSGETEANDSRESKEEDRKDLVITEPSTESKATVVSAEVIKDAEMPPKRKKEDLSLTQSQASKVTTRVVNRSYSMSPLHSFLPVHIDKDGVPVSAPISSLDALMQQYPGGDSLCIPVMPLRPRARKDPKKPRTLVCHDMMGGYTVDRYVQGYGTVEDYHFYHWHLIDYFVYFSHNLVSIPPPSWTNSAHQHGVYSLGTFITEWEGGAKICSKLFSSEFQALEAVGKLVMLAEYYQMDGWLVNIENPIVPQCVPVLQLFLQQLTNQMHERRPGSLVIWYDSVTINGDLKWQNALNQLNKSYFDLCDGIFLNYNWNHSLLSLSRQVAQDRWQDVFVGVDVFGRGCPGGGGYNTCAAMDIIQKANLSAAIFAPGWVFETKSKEKFIENQNRFWELLEPYCQAKGVVGLPLVSAFGRGYGNMLAVNGEVVQLKAWTNHSSMDLQPSFISSVLQIGGKDAPSVYPVNVSLSEAYNNFGSLCIRGNIPPNSFARKARTMVRLFYAQVSLKNPVLVSLTFKMESKGSAVQYYLQLCTDRSPRYVLLKGAAELEESGELDEVDHTLLSRYGVPKSQPCSLPPGVDESNYVGFRPLSLTYAAKLHKAFTGSSELRRNDWITNYFLVSSKELTQCSVHEIRLVCAPAPLGGAPSTSGDTPSNSFTLYLGEVKLLSPKCLQPFMTDVSDAATPQPISSLQCSNEYWDSNENKYAALLSWTVAMETTDPVHYCNVYQEYVHDLLDHSAPLLGTNASGNPEYIGRAHGEYYVLQPITVPPDVSQVVFYVQPVTASRRAVPLSRSPHVTVQFSS